MKANVNKLNVFKKVLQEVCEKFDDAEDFNDEEKLKRFVVMKNYQWKRYLICL